MVGLHLFKPTNLTQTELADAIRVPCQRISELVEGERAVTPSTALRLAKFFRMSPDFWMMLQIRWDLFQFQQLEAEELEEDLSSYNLKKVVHYSFEFIYL